MSTFEALWVGLRRPLRTASSILTAAIVCLSSSKIAYCKSFDLDEPQTAAVLCFGALSGSIGATSVYRKWQSKISGNRRSISFVHQTNRIHLRILIQPSTYYELDYKPRDRPGTLNYILVFGTLWIILWQEKDGRDYIKGWYPRWPRWYPQCRYLMLWVNTRPLDCIQRVRFPLTCIFLLFL